MFTHASTASSRTESWGEGGNKEGEQKPHQLRANSPDSGSAAGRSRRGVGRRPTCSSEARLENMGMISLLTLSSSSTLANSPSLEAAARRTMGVSSEHRFRKYLGR